MIVDLFAHSASFAHLPWFETIREYLATHDLRGVAAGRYDVLGDELYVVVADDTARPDEPLLEAHRAYIDLQLTIEGSYDVLWKPLAECTMVAREYDAADDLLFMADRASTRLHLSEGMAAVFFPGDAHAPQPPADRVRKAVFKISVKLS